MDLKRLLRAGTPLEVSVLALIAAVFGAGCLFVAAFPLAPDAPKDLMVGFGLLGIAVAAALALAGGAAGPAHLHAAVVFLTVLRGVMIAVAAGERGLMIGALGYIWTAVYVAYFFRPGVAKAHAGLMIGSLGVALLAARAPTDVSVWVIVSAMVWVAVVVLSRLNERLRTEAHTDALTGLLNRTGLAAAAARQRAMSTRRGEPLALAVIDLDGFKTVNDRGGHAAGDRLLRELAKTWTGFLRPGDLLARFGGDEFVLLLAGADEDQLGETLDRLAGAYPMAWTAGTVLWSQDESLYAALDRADARLYEAKGRGPSTAASAGPRSERSLVAVAAAAR